MYQSKGWRVNNIIQWVGVWPASWEMCGSSSWCCDHWAAAVQTGWILQLETVWGVWQHHDGDDKETGPETWHTLSQPHDAHPCSHSLWCGWQCFWQTLLMSGPEHWDTIEATLQTQLPGKLWDKIKHKYPLFRAASKDQEPTYQRGLELLRSIITYIHINKSICLPSYIRAIVKFRGLGNWKLMVFQCCLVFGGFRLYFFANEIGWKVLAVRLVEVEGQTLCQ